MKKKILGSMLALVLTVSALGIGGLQVSAEEEAVSAAETEEPLTEITEAAEEEDPAQKEDTLEEELPEEETVDRMEEEAETVESEEESTEDAAKNEKEITGMPVILDNSLDMAIISLQVKNFFADEYSENLLAEGEEAEAEAAVTVGIPESVLDRNLGMYDVRVTFADGSVAEIPLVPFLENATGVLYKENGTFLILVRDQRLEDAGEAVSESESIRLEAEASRAMAAAID